LRLNSIIQQIAEMKYIFGSFASDWLSTDDMLKLLAAHASEKWVGCSPLAMQMPTYMQQFFKKSGASVSNSHQQLLRHCPSNTLFKFNLNYDASEVKEALRKTLKARGADIDYRLLVLSTLSEYRFSPHMSDMAPEDQAKSMAFSLYAIMRSTPPEQWSQLFKIALNKCSNSDIIQFGLLLKIFIQAAHKLDSIQALELTQRLLEKFEHIKPGYEADVSLEHKNCRNTLLKFTASAFAFEFKSEEAQQWIINWLLSTYNKKPDTIICALKIIPALIPTFDNTSKHQFTSALLTMLDDSDKWLADSFALQAINTLTPTFIPIDASRWIERLFEKLNSSNVCIRKNASLAIAAMLPSLDAIEAQQWITLLLTRLNDLDSLVRTGALNAITALVSTFDTSRAKQFIHPLLEELNLLSDSYALERDISLAETVTALLHKLEAEDALLFAKPLFRMLDDSEYLGDETSKIIAALLSKLEEVEASPFIGVFLTKLHNDHSEYGSLVVSMIGTVLLSLRATQAKQFIQPLLAKLNDSNTSRRRSTIMAISVLLPKLTTIEARQFIEPLLACLNDSDFSTRMVATREMARLISKLETTQAQQFIEPLLARLNDSENIKYEALEIIESSFSKFEPASMQKFIEPLLVTLKESSRYTKQRALKTMAHFISTLRANDQGELELIAAQTFMEPLLACLKHEDKIVRDRAQENITMLAQNMSTCLLSNTISILKSYLSIHESEITRREGLMALSTILVHHPDLDYQFDDLDDTLEKLCIVSMVNMQKSTQPPKPLDEFCEQPTECRMVNRP